MGIRETRRVAGEQQPRIELSWKISEVIRTYPSLVDELVAINPTFRMLRNPVMRRVQSRLVTVAQAAEIANLSPELLVRRLNVAVGLDEPDDRASTTEARPAERDTPPWVGSVPITRTLDVRPLQREGREPFSDIMEAARQVPNGEGFRLLNTFEPVPLYGVLGARGFVHWARQVEPEQWEILFFNSGVKSVPQSETAAPRSASQPANPAAWEEPSATLTIDVSELVPPEPMIRILEALEQLPEGGTLLVHHVRRPMHLYPRLDTLGYRHETRELGPDRIEVLIEKTAGGSVTAG